MRSNAKSTALMFVAFSLVVCSIAGAKDKSNYELVDGKVRFVCEGPDVVIPAWGEFATLEAALSLDPKKLNKAKGHVDVLMVSMRTEDTAWDTMFRRAGFLEIEEHPRSRFVVERIQGKEQLEANKWTRLRLKGHFTLHGITKAITVPASAKWIPGDGKKSDELIVRAFFHITWDEYQIAMPTGSTRSFAGDGARIHIDLKYQGKDARKKKRRN